jgi:hypothetical protein
MCSAFSLVKARKYPTTNLPEKPKPRPSRPKKQKLNLQLSMLQPQAITVEMLPPLVPRPVAAVFGLISKRTLQRAELAGRLTPVRRGAQNVSYKKEELLKFLGIGAPPVTAAAKASRASTEQKKRAA